MSDLLTRLLSGSFSHICFPAFVVFIDILVNIICFSNFSDMDDDDFSPFFDILCDCSDNEDEEIEYWQNEAEVSDNFNKLCESPGGHCC